ncbi:cyclic lactone autoinducer peptide [Paenibacillus filicis]|uniref:Cyclic lactone autoinducer peptide n=1 Tax=Paenibacillus gyeongsangnamensis TaxID=3388067 RepID=A0ABT4Q597_9BACL|nr:cyclic lactone autoinducer peptide [Paenibacillus filicis]MCZ8512011.1 cyclic lactone autoinducer peptide [Paenibacillus filicis]
MKINFFKFLNTSLMVIASVFVFTNSVIFNRPETPAELLKK